MAVVIISMIFIGMLAVGLAFSAGRMVGRVEERTRSTVKAAKERQASREKPEEADFVEIKE